MFRRVLVAGVAAALMLVASGIAGAATLVGADNFADATEITALPDSFSQSTVGMTLEADEPQPCSSSIGATVWFKYTPSADVHFVADTSGSAFDTMLAVYTGTWGSLTEVACDDDGIAFAGASLLHFTASAGTTYWFQVGGFAGNTGDLVFNLSTLTVGEPDNDDFAAAEALTSLPASDTTDTTTATVEDGEPEAYWIGATLWYSYTPSADVSLVADTEGSFFDTALAVYTGSWGSLAMIGWDDDSGSGATSRLVFSASAGTTYWFQVGGFYESAGILVFNLAEETFTYYVDADDDGYGSTTTVTSSSPTPGPGESATSDDCNDNEPTINPGAADIPGDGIDQNCSGGDAFAYYLDADGDTYGSTTTVVSESPTPGLGESLTADDCDDSDATMHPGATDIPGDGIDQDCDGADVPLPPDPDGDGILGSDDYCPGSALGTPPPQLKKNRFAANLSGLFVDALGKPSGYTIVDTLGCDEDQIIALMGLGRAHTLQGITRSVLETFVATYG